MKLILLIAAIGHLTTTINAIECKPSGVQCLNNREYQICSTVNGEGVLVGKIKPCAEDRHCDDASYFPCLPGAPPTTTTTLAPITAPPCYGSSKHQAPECYQYFECVPNWWWWEPRLQTCSDGLAFDAIAADCTEAAAASCQRPAI